MSGVNPSTGYGRDVRARVDDYLQRWIRTPLSMLSFWMAIAVPALYIPLFVSGINTPDELALFLGLFGLHILGLIGGRHYRRESE